MGICYRVLSSEVIWLDLHSRNNSASNHSDVLKPKSDVILLFKFFQRCNISLRKNVRSLQCPKRHGPSDHSVLICFCTLCSLAAPSCAWCPSARLFAWKTLPIIIHGAHSSPPPALAAVIPCPAGEVCSDHPMESHYCPYSTVQAPSLLFLHSTYHSSFVRTVHCSLLVPRRHRAHAWQILLNKGMVGLWQMGWIE